MESERNWMTQKEAAAFVGSNTSFYLEKWKEHSETTLKGWNWAAMFFGIEWMVYRKMYLEAMLFFLISIGIGGVAALFLRDLTGNLWGHCFRILIGVFGNTLYRNKALRILQRINTQNDSERLNILSQRGGVSPISVVVLIFLEFVYVFFVFQ